ncbi:MAG: hypothetical protein CSA65_03720 [Proteobacteria bacterium]|nr:MAG: hypothetical protein CSB49_04550 [Pseudomonadota bacterium]PIE18923.1 MAG: hypothetical protein CSA65_03720 [Pseudomonadota bacterium]
MRVSDATYSSPEKRQRTLISDPAAFVARPPETIKRYLLCGTLALTVLGVPTLAAGRAPRRIAVLEYRAGTRAASGLAVQMAQQLAKLTPHRVLKPADAQRQLGSRVDALVARCQGDPTCLARIGARLGVDEIVLVGVSQLGDIILAIQRIQVPSGKVLTRLADSLSRRRRVSKRVVNRYLRRLLPPDEFKRYGTIVVQTSAVGDQVFIDQKLSGRTPLQPVVVPAPGRYAVRIRRRGHVDFVARLDVLPESSVEVKPTLSPIGVAQPKRWFERWWVWALVGGAVAGATTAVVLSATRSPSDVAAKVRWPSTARALRW